MKFRAVISDHVYMKEFLHIILTFSKLSKESILAISPDNIMFIVNEEASINAPILWCKIDKNSYFSEFYMEGLTNEYNQIFLSFQPTNLARSVSVLKNAAKFCKIKLQNKQFPCLTIEIEVPSGTSLETKKITHDVPINLIARRDWSEYDVPKLPPTHITTAMPSLRSISNLVNKMKNLSPYLTVNSTSLGDLSFITETEQATVTNNYKNLEVDSNGTTRASSGDIVEVSCRVDSKKLGMFLSSNQLHGYVMWCSLTQDHCIKIFINLRDDVILNSVIPSACL